jgi:hypothetical protein
MIGAQASRRAVQPRRALVVGVLLACGLLALVPQLTGCNGNIPQLTSTTQVPDTAAADTTTEAPVTAAALATGVVDAWTEAMQKLDLTLKGFPKADAIRAEVESLREEYIQRLLVFGRQRLGLTPAEQEEMNSLVFAGISALAQEPWYTNYMSAYDQYSTGDLEFANLLASFNILTQYADFELLKQQEPEEAARLGVE